MLSSLENIKSKNYVYFQICYILKKDYNSSGEKFGDYTSISLFASKTIYRKWGVVGQLKGEWVNQLEANDTKLASLAEWELETWEDKQKSSGSTKVFFIPQVSYSKNDVTLFATSNIPLYQNLNGIQVGSQFQFTLGINYRFFVKDCAPEPELKK